MKKRPLLLLVALLAIPAAAGKALAMTCNIARPYGSELGKNLPCFSRLRPDMLFQKGDRIELFAFPHRRPMRCSWQLSRNMVETPFLSGEGTPCMDESVKVTIPAEKLTTGFYDVKLTIAATATEKEEGKITFGYRVEGMPITPSRPADFDEFWRKAKADLARVPLRASESFVREMSDAEVSRYNVEGASIPEEYDPQGKRCDRIRVYKVQFDSAGGKRVYGWLALPDGKGPFPGLVVLPGAGNGPVPIPAEHARHGYAALMLRIHPQDVEDPDNKMPAGYLAYLREGCPERTEEDYYRDVYLACCQAVRYLASRPDVDPGRLAVAGASQGGLLAMVTGGLCPEVKAVVSSLCFYAYFPFRDQVAALNRLKESGLEASAPPFDPSNPRQKHMGYYDPVNFAPRVKGATLMCACLCDMPSPATSVYAVYRSLGKVPKELLTSPGTNHDFIIEFEQRAWRWLDARLGAGR